MAQVCRGHGICHTRLQIDLFRGAGDLVFGLEPDRFRRPEQPVPRGFCGVAHAAPATHDVMHPVEPFGLGKAQRGAGGLFRLDAAEHGRSRQPHDRDEQQRGDRPCPRRIALTRVQAVEVMADRDPHEEYQRRDQPVHVRREGQRVVVAEHQENNRQSQIVIMRAALFGDLAVFRIRHPSRLEVGHHDPLVRHDDEKHVCRHDRRGESPQMQQRRAPRKDRRIEIGHPHEDHIQADHQPRVVVAEFAFANLIVDQPAKAKRQQGNPYRLPACQFCNTGINKIEFGPEVVDQDQQRKAREPR